MPSQEDIEEQKQLLAAHRRTLAHLLKQQAQFSVGYIPAHVANGIQDARDEIARIKRALREWGIELEDLENDIQQSKQSTEEVRDKQVNNQSQHTTTKQRSSPVKSQTRRPESVSNPPKSVTGLLANLPEPKRANSENQHETPSSFEDKLPHTNQSNFSSYSLNRQIPVVFALFVSIFASFTSIFIGIKYFLVLVPGLSIVGFIMGLLIYFTWNNGNPPIWLLNLSRYLDDRSSIAKLSFMFSILGLTLLPLIGSIVAVILGHYAYRKINRSEIHHNNTILVIFGLVFGYFNILILIFISFYLYYYFLHK